MRTSLVVKAPDDHEQDVRLNVREPGVGAQLPLSCCSRVGLHDTRTRGGNWREQARRSLCSVLKSCARGLQHEHWYRSAAPARTPAHLRCMPASTAAQLHALATSCAAVPTSEPAECGGWRVSKVFLGKAYIS